MSRTLFHIRSLLLLTIAVSVVAAGASRASPVGWNLTSTLGRTISAGLTLTKAEKLSEAVTDRPASTFSRLRGIKGSTAHQFDTVGKPSLAHVRKSILSNVPHQNISAVNAVSTQYAIDCTWDGIPVSLIFDTGSADTWVAGTGFSCEDYIGQTEERSSCGFGKPYIDGFNQGGEIDDVHFSLSYGSGETVSGPMGYSDVSCGGLSVSRQQVGLANQTYWRGNNITVGILGLAHPALTSAFYGPVGSEAPWNAVTYSTFLKTAASQGSIDPTFSVAILKASSEGVMAWGGLPPIPYDSRKNASADLLIANIGDKDGTGWRPSFYTIVPDGMRWGSVTDDANYPYIVDTGTTLMHLPPPLAESIARAFDPPAEYMPRLGSYFTTCNAVAPEVAVIIGGVEFSIRPADLIYRELMHEETGYCVVGITSGGDGPYILGDVFLQNVVAVFDVGAGEMRFYGRH